MKTDDAYRDISGDVEKRFDTLNYDETMWKVPLPVRKNKKVIVLKKDEKAGKMITKLSTATPKSYSYCVQKNIIK